MTAAGPQIRFAPVAYGYGPIGKALHVARALRACLGPDAGLELVAPPNFQVTAEPGLFDSVTSAPTRRADVVISFMNRAAAAEARTRGERVVFVDSLAWLWDAPIPVHDAIDLYLYQALPFLPVPQRNLEGFRATAPVGAIIGSVHSLRGVQSRVIVSLSGLENFEVSVERGNMFYPGIVVRALATLSERDDIVVFGNPRALDAADLPERFDRGSGRQTDFLRQAASARRVVLSPGLTTICELLCASVPIGLLPPQNYSQVRIAAALRNSCVEIPQLAWQSEPLDWLIHHEVPERVGSQIVRNLICERWLDPSGLPPEEMAALLDAPSAAIPTDTVETLLGTPCGAADVAAHVATRL